MPKTQDSSETPVHALAQGLEANLDLSPVDQCDRNPDGCSQCARAKKACPGYRNQLDLMFRDENSRVIKKSACHQQASKSASPTSRALLPATGDVVADLQGSTEPLDRVEMDRPGNLPPNRPILPHQANQSPPESVGLIPAAIPSTGEALGTAVFFSQYIRTTDMALDPGFFHFAQPVLDNSESDVHGVTACMAAVGLAGMANVENQPHLIDEARKYYVRGLSSTNAAIRDPQEAVKDTTLLSIMVLGFYEQIACLSKKSLRAWIDHINGAAELVRMRGHQQVTYETGLQMFLQFSHGLVISCIQQEMRTPPGLIELRRECAKHVDVQSPTWTATEVLIKLIDLRYQMKTGLSVSSEEMVNQAVKLDMEFQAVFETSAGEWQYQTITNSSLCDDPRIFQGTYHIYAKPWTAQLWNWVRCGRVLLHECIRKEMLKGFQRVPPLFITPEHSSVFSASLKILLRMLHNILASTPQRLGWVRRNGSVIPCQSRETGTGTTAQELIATGANMILWPLFVAGTMSTSIRGAEGSVEVRSYVVRALAEIGQETGILQASMLARMLETEDMSSIWDETGLRVAGLKQIPVST